MKVWLKYLMWVNAMKVKANYFDGQTAECHPIEVIVTPVGLYLPSGDTWFYSDMKLLMSDQSDGRLSYENKTLDGPGLTLLFEGGMADPAWDYLSRVSKKLTGGSSWHFVRWQMVTGAAIIGLMMVFYGLYPYANRALVAVIPDSWAIKAGDLVIDSLYTEYSSNACHTAAGDKALDKLVQAVQMPGLAYPLRVQVVQHAEVNALTAPGGRIVILNGLLQQATSSDEIAGILAHEVGHVYYKHPMQGMVNVMGFSIVGSFFGGDAASIAVVALSMSYSRDLERQADNKALETLSNNGISAKGLLTFFNRLQDKNKDSVGAQLERLISTHPLSEERVGYIAAHIKAEEEDPKSQKTFTPALTDTEWQALKDICSPQDES